MRSSISAIFSRLPVEKLSIPRTVSPCANTARASADPMNPPTPVIRYLAIDSHHKGGCRNQPICRPLARSLEDDDDGDNRRARTSRIELRAHGLVRRKKAGLIAAKGHR